MRKPRGTLVIMIVVFAVAAHAGVGSVISSFYLGYDLHSGIYRDRNYVYNVLYRIDASVIVITKRMASGSNVGIVCSLSRGSYADADHSPLGEGYFSLTASGTPDVIHDRDSATGSIVASWSPRDDISAYAYVPGGHYKYVGDGERVFRYTTAGTFVSSFRAGHYTLAATDCFCGASGEYVVAAGHDLITVYRDGGAFVCSFTAPPGMENYGACCGPGYPDECGTTLWCIYFRDFWPYYYDPYAYQISLGNGVAVAPTSVGKIKALFR